MFYKLAADAVVVIHFLFIIFAVAGGLLLFWRRWIVWFHVPAVIWAVMIGWKGWICPLTPLENHLRRQVQLSTYQESFIEHYLLPVIYPAGLTPEIRYVLGVLVIVANLLSYGMVLYSFKHRR